MFRVPCTQSTSNRTGLEGRPGCLTDVQMTTDNDDQ